MAAAIESPVQFERDLRSVNKEWKRDKDSSEKWAMGSRPLNGVFWNLATAETYGGTSSMRAKDRPTKKLSDYPHYYHKRKNSNAIKAHRSHPDVYRHGNGRVGGKFGAQGDIDDVSSSPSIADLLVPASRKEGGAESWGLHSMDGVLYSFDAADTPARPVTLETFVKANTPTTERLVEKEYEVLDVNGELLKGRKARRNLRNSTTSAPEQGASATFLQDDDDFELV